jgi:tripartite-type tricarboxylate transporter receptor subunit TctC
MVFRQAIGVELQTVPYQGTAPALNALLGGQVDLLCDQTTQTTQHIKAETVKLYGVTTLERIKALPNAPTLNELGMKGFQVVVWHGVYAPKGTPQAALDKLNGAVRAALEGSHREPAHGRARRRDRARGEADARGSAHWLKTEIDRWGPVIRAAGVYAD